MLAVVIAEGLALLLLALLVAGLLRSHAEILRALHQLGVDLDPDHRPGELPLTVRRGGLAPPSGDDAAYDVVGTRLDGSAVAVGVVGAERDTLLAFLSSGCSTCEPFWSAFRAGVDVPGDARLVVVVQDEDSPGVLRELAGPHLDVVASSAAWSAYGVPGSPHFVLVAGRSGRVVGEGTAAGWAQVRGLLAQARPAGPPTDPRDDPHRIDAELLAAGIGPGHRSLYEPPDADTGERR